MNLSSATRNIGRCNQELYVGRKMNVILSHKQTESIISLVSKKKQVQLLYQK